MQRDPCMEGQQVIFTFPPEHRMKVQAIRAGINTMVERTLVETKIDGTTLKRWNWRVPKSKDNLGKILIELETYDNGLTRVYTQIGGKHPEITEVERMLESWLLYLPSDIV